MIGARSVDHRQPGLHVDRPMVASSRLTTAACPFGKVRTSSGVANVLTWSRGIRSRPFSRRSMVPPSYIIVLRPRSEGLQDSRGSLIVGGLSVVNTMAMSVNERTREIGIKRAIGGSRRRIIAELVGEALLIGFLGGLVVMTGWAPGFGAA